MQQFTLKVVSAVVALAPATAMAETPRQLLTAAAFEAPNKARALALVGQAIAAADKILATDPDDREAMLQRAVAIGYRGKLTGSRTDVRASLPVFERLAAQNPRDAEAQIVLAGWHLGAVDQLGGFLARTALGARIQVGETALARAVALGGNRAFYPGIAAMLQIRRDPKNLTVARKWAEMAATAPTPTSLDALMKRSANALLPALRANDGKKASDLAHKLLPFGRIPE